MPFSNRNFSYIFSPDILWGNVSSQSETGLCPFHPILYTGTICPMYLLSSMPQSSTWGRHYTSWFLPTVDVVVQCPGFSLLLKVDVCHVKELIRYRELLRDVPTGLIPRSKELQENYLS